MVALQLRIMNMHYLHNHAFQANAMNMINTYNAEAKQYTSNEY